MFFQVSFFFLLLSFLANSIIDILIILLFMWWYFCALKRERERENEQNVKLLNTIKDNKKRILYMNSLNQSECVHVTNAFYFVLWTKIKATE